ncbi:MAG: hypothetical protein LBS92_00745 [Candidatus Methanoplasma sp.]|jgi:hypothetical protein|nr:hypothetical protein [Candidatus Methanoplasma sp.]
MRDQTIIAVVAVFAVTVFVGQVLVYGANPYVNGASAWMTEDGVVEYSVSSNTSAEYTAALMDNGGMYDVREVAIYWDSDYPVHNTQKYVEDKKAKIVSELKIRNSVTVSEVDAEQLRGLMSNDVLSGKNKAAVLMMTGAFPDTVYDGSDDSLALTWLEGGGVLYWIGCTIGRYVAERGDGPLKEVEGYANLFFGAESDAAVGHGSMPYPSPDGSGVPVIDDRSNHSDVPSKDWGMAAALGVYYNITMFGLDTSGLSDFLSLGYTDGTYESAVLIKYHRGDGMIALLGGDPTSDAAPQVAQIISSKLSYASEIAEVKSGTVSNGTVYSGFWDCNGKSDVYIFFGTPMVFYARSFSLG